MSDTPARATVPAEDEYPEELRKYRAARDAVLALSENVVFPHFDTIRPRDQDEELRLARKQEESKKTQIDPADYIHASAVPLLVKSHIRALMAENVITYADVQAAFLDEIVPFTGTVAWFNRDPYPSYVKVEDATPEEVQRDRHTLSVMFFEMYRKYGARDEAGTTDASPAPPPPSPTPPTGPVPDISARDPFQRRNVSPEEETRAKVKAEERSERLWREWEERMAQALGHPEAPTVPPSSSSSGDRRTHVPVRLSVDSSTLPPQIRRVVVVPTPINHESFQNFTDSDSGQQQIQCVLNLHPFLPRAVRTPPFLMVLSCIMDQRPEKLAAKIVAYRDENPKALSTCSLDVHQMLVASLKHEAKVIERKAVMSHHGKKWRPLSSTHQVLGTYVSLLLFFENIDVRRTPAPVDPAHEQLTTTTADILADTRNLGTAFMNIRRELRGFRWKAAMEKIDAKARQPKEDTHRDSGVRVVEEEEEEKDEIQERPSPADVRSRGTSGEGKNARRKRKKRGTADPSSSSSAPRPSASGDGDAPIEDDAEDDPHTRAARASITKRAEFVSRLVEVYFSTLMGDPETRDLLEAALRGFDTKVLVTHASPVHLEGRRAYRDVDEWMMATDDRVKRHVRGVMEGAELVYQFAFIRFIEGQLLTFLGVDERAWPMFLGRYDVAPEHLVDPLLKESLRYGISVNYHYGNKVDPFSYSRIPRDKRNLDVWDSFVDYPTLEMLLAKAVALYRLSTEPEAGEGVFRMEPHETITEYSDRISRLSSLDNDS